MREFSLHTYYDLKKWLRDNGYNNEIGWAEDIKECDNSNQFCREAIWVILNSGMKEQIARIIQDRIYKALGSGIDIEEVFKHKGKTDAIKFVMLKRTILFYEYQTSNDKVNYLKTIPYIGNITKYHLAKNLGLDFCKPDRHLERIAKTYNTTPVKLCQKIADETDDRIGVVDIVLWRSANLKRI